MNSDGEYLWLDMGDGRSVYRRVVPRETQRSDLPAPMLMLDTMDPLWHPHTGELVDSKSHFRAITKASGGEEVGNDAQASAPKGSDISKADVAEAVNMLKGGYKPEVTLTESALSTPD